MNMNMNITLADLCTACLLTPTRVLPILGVVWVIGIHGDSITDNRIQILERLVDLIYPQYELIIEPMTTMTRLELRLK
jgi:hypothetical protein